MSGTSGVCDRHSCLAVRLSDDDAGFIAGALRHAAELYRQDAAKLRAEYGALRLVAMFEAQAERALALSARLTEG